MLACILAGGEGTRLRPLTSFLPKPMTELGERPVLGHILGRLRSAGITRAAVTVMYLPEVIRRGIGDGREYGVEITYRMEESPLGTAGAARACADLLEEGEDMLVLSGDGIFDADFSALAAAHKKNSALVTMVLSHVSEPTEYGLVRTDGAGRVLGFAEKPDWDGVFTDLVNTGIYILSKEALMMIPEGKKYDFSGDLFPSLLPSGRLFGFVSRGYWCDIGSPEAYLKCHMDYLEGRTGLSPEAPERESGVWVSKKASVSPEAKLISPVLICEGARVEAGVRLGPGVVLGPGAVAEANSSAVGSAVYGRLGRGAEVEDTIVCREAVVGTCSVARRGSIIGPGAHTGDHSFVAAGAVLEENACMESGSVKKAGRQGDIGRVHFENGALPGEAELCFALGRALCAMGKRRALVGERDNPAAASALTAGLLSGGAEVLYHDGSFCAAAAELCPMLRGEVGLFLSGEKLWIYGETGMPLSPGEQRKLLFALSRGQGGEKTGNLRRISGAEELIAASAAIPGEKRTPVWVSGEGGAREVMEKALRLSGFRVENTKNAILLGPTADGFGFRMEYRGEFSTEHTRGMSLLALAKSKPGAPVALHATDPAAFALAVNRCGSAVLRVGRDADGAELAAKQGVGFYGARSAVFLLAELDRTGLSPEELFGELPPYATVSAEVSCETPRARLMGRMVGSFSPDAAQGVTVSTPRGVATLCPSAVSQKIKIVAEAANAEIAGSIAGDMVRLAKSLDIKS